MNESKHEIFDSKSKQNTKAIKPNLLKKKMRQCTTERSKTNSYITVANKNKGTSRAMTLLIVQAAQTIFLQKERLEGNVLLHIYTNEQITQLTLWS